MSSAVSPLLLIAAVSGLLTAIASIRFAFQQNARGNSTARDFGVIGAVVTLFIASVLANLA